MPHLIVEFPQDAVAPHQVAGLLDAAHRAAVASGLFDTSHVKSRALPLAYYRRGSDDRPFVHAQLRIKPGRSAAQKQALSQAVLAAIRGQGLAVAVITVEVVELDAASYAKHEA